MNKPATQLSFCSTSPQSHLVLASQQSQLSARKIKKPTSPQSRLRISARWMSGFSAAVNPKKTTTAS